MNVNKVVDCQSGEESEEFFDQVSIGLGEEINGGGDGGIAASEDSYNSASDGETSLKIDPRPSYSSNSALNNAETTHHHLNLVHSIGQERPEFLDAPLVHEAFEAIAAQYPNRQCLHFNEQWSTYAETSLQVSQLAGYLQSLENFAPGVVVALMLERSFELVISILAVLKAGGCYLPCDPSYPDERLKMYLEDGGTAVVIVDPKHAQRAKELVSGVGGNAGAGGVAIISPNDARISTSLDSSTSKTRNTATVVGPEDPAYIIFTSGSTGRPKGVVIPHRSLRDHVLGTAEYYGIGPNDTSLLTITINFDPHLMQIVPCLVVGARLVIARPDGHTDTEYLSSLISRENVTHIVSTPSLALVQFRSPKIMECTSLRCVMVGGEAMQREVITLFAAKVR
jgi:rhizoxin biosynthesis, polyketide synthase / nonribosomal peptide synthetase RhiB